MSNFSVGEVAIVVGGPGYRGKWTRVGDEVTVVEDLGTGTDQHGRTGHMYHVDSPRIRDQLAQQTTYGGIALFEQWMRRRDPPDKQDWRKLCALAPRVAAPA